MIGSAPLGVQLTVVWKSPGPPDGSRWLAGVCRALGLTMVAGPASLADGGAAVVLSESHAVLRVSAGWCLFDLFSCVPLDVGAALGAVGADFVHARLAHRGHHTQSGPRPALPGPWIRRAALRMSADADAAVGRLGPSARVQHRFHPIGRTAVVEWGGGDVHIAHSWPERGLITLDWLCLRERVLPSADGRSLPEAVGRWADGPWRRVAAHLSLGSLETCG